jgi:iron complex transport system ATP-binding protein
MILTTRDLGYSVRGTSIVRNVAMEIREGETFGLVGPNGSGKSTLLRLIQGILRPSKGASLLHGENVASMPRRRIAQMIAFVEQHSDSVDRLTVRDVVELGRNPWLSALQPWSAKEDRIVDQALADVEMSTLAERLWHTLSGGERQRVQLARALAQRPQLLLLDEPTNHLDIHHQLAILGLVKGLPVTAVVALHDLNHALACDRVGVMHGGRLIAVGPPRETLTPDLLRAVFGVRTSMLIDPADGRQVMSFTL